MNSDEAYLERTKERLRNLPSVKKGDRSAKEIREMLARTHNGRKQT